MSIKIQGNGYLVRKLYASMVNGFMQRNGVPQEDIEQIAVQFEDLIQPIPVKAAMAASQPEELPEQNEFSVLINELRNCAT